MCIDFTALVAMAVTAAQIIDSVCNTRKHTHAPELISFVVICTRFGHDMQSFSFASNDDYYYFVDLFTDGFSENYTVHVTMENIFYLRNHNHNHNDVPRKLNLMLSWSSRWLNFQNRYDNCCPKVQNLIHSITSF